MSSSDTEPEATRPAAGISPAGKPASQPAGKEPADATPPLTSRAQKKGPRRASAPATAERGLLPNKAAEDDPQGWGDRAESYDHDAWLREQKPPHWG